MQFDVYQNKNTTTSQRFPYLLDVQASLLQSLQTRVVVPLAPKKAFEKKVITRLMPILEIQGEEYVAVMPQIAGIPARELQNPITNASLFRAEIIAALDLLITGV